MKTRKFKRKSNILSLIMAFLFILGSIITAGAEETVFDGLEYSIKDGYVTITSYTGTASELVIPDRIQGNSVVSIGDDAFYGCNNLETITIPDSVLYIEDQAFGACKNLKNVWLSEGVERIGAMAFGGCVSLENITIPSTVTSVEDSAFMGCEYLKNVYITDVNAWCNIEFANDVANPICTSDNLVYYADPVLNVNGKPIKDVVLSNDVRTIPADAFQSTTLESISISESVTNINERAFYATNISNIVIPDTVESLSYAVFAQCVYLKNVTLSSNLTSIEWVTFKGCSSLEQVTIPEGVVLIDDQAFDECVGLESITLPDSVENIGAAAFRGCSSLTDVYYAGTESQWKQIIIEEKNECLRNAAIHFESILMDKNFEYKVEDGEITITGYTGDDEYLVVPEKIDGLPVTAIGDAAFHGCDFSEIVLPNTLKRIGSQAFEACSEVIYFKIPDSVEIIDSFSFDGCYRMKAITLPEQLSEIGIGVFRNCEGLENIGISEGCENFSSVNGVLYSKDNKTLVSFPANNRNITTVDIPDGVTSIGDYAFYGCRYIEEINIPGSVEYCGVSVFDGTSCLENINVNINNEIFCSVSGVLFSKDKTTILKYPEGKTSTSYSVPNGVKHIGEHAFQRCRNLENIEICYGLVDVDWYAFYGCTSLKMITIPSSVTRIGHSAFELCDNLTVVIFSGTEEQWVIIEIDEGNEYLANAKIIYTTENEVHYLVGDANCDDKINVKDATEIQKAAAELLTLSELGKVSADVDDNGRVNVKDATAIQKYVAGLSTGFAIGMEKLK